MLARLFPGLIASLLVVYALVLAFGGMADIVAMVSSLTP